MYTEVLLLFFYMYQHKSVLSMYQKSIHCHLTVTNFGLANWKVWIAGAFHMVWPSIDWHKFITSWTETDSEDERCLEKSQTWRGIYFDV